MLKVETNGHLLCSCYLELQQGAVLTVRREPSAQSSGHTAHWVLRSCQFQVLSKEVPRLPMPSTWISSLGSSCLEMLPPSEYLLRPWLRDSQINKSQWNVLNSIYAVSLNYMPATQKSSISIFWENFFCLLGTSSMDHTSPQVDGICLTLACGTSIWLIISAATHLTGFEN